MPADRFTDTSPLCQNESRQIADPCRHSSALENAPKLVTHLKPSNQSQSYDILLNKEYDSVVQYAAAEFVSNSE